LGRNRETASNSAIRLANRIIIESRVVGDTFPYRIMAKSAPQQNNGRDCGVFVCAITEFLVNKLRENNLDFDCFKEEGAEDLLEINNNINQVKERIIPIREWLRAEGLEEGRDNGFSYSHEALLNINFRFESVRQRLEGYFGEDEDETFHPAINI